MIVGIVIAAGRSARLGRPKQLLPLGGKPLLAHAVGAALASVLDEVILVVGHEAAAIEQVLAPGIGETRTRVVVNPRYADGQASSIVTGIAAAPPETEAALVLLGDQPGVKTATIDRILVAYREHRPPIVAPVYGGTIGNPILFRHDLFAELGRLTGDEGARGLVRRRAGEVVRVETGLPSPPQDVDTEADYAALLTTWNQPVP